jgi:hypothetical protein
MNPIRIVLSLMSLVFAATFAMAEVHVLPVVADQAPGRNDSLWSTQVQILTLNPGEVVEVRRVWVALEGGGFADDPETAPRWRFDVEPFHEDYPDPSDMPVDTRRIFILNGASLLQGTGARVGAVGLEIDGEAVVTARITNVTDETWDRWSRGTSPFQYIGLGQLVTGATTPLLGASMLPWLTPDSTRGETDEDCKVNSPCYWRNNVGLVNPTAEPVEITLEVSAFFAIPLFDYPDPPCPTRGVNEVCPAIAGEPYYNRFSDWYRTTVDLEPWGWTQINSIDYRFIIEAGFPFPAYPSVNVGSSNLVLNILPQDDETPYFAYLSQVYSGVHDANDPAYIPAIPGRFISIYDEEASQAPHPRAPE